MKIFSSSKKIVAIVALISVLILAAGSFLFYRIYIDPKLPSEDLNDVKFLTKLNQGDYFVSFSRAFEHPTKLAVYASDGKLLETTNIDGQAIHSVKTLDNLTFFSSERFNKHFLVDAAGKVTSYNFSPEKYGKGEGFGTSAFETGEGYIVSSVNVGKTDKTYKCEVFYQKGDKDNKKSIELSGGYIDAMKVYEDTLYAHYSGDNGNDAGIYIVDLKEDKLIDNIKVTDMSLQEMNNQNKGKGMELFGDKLLMAGYINNEDEKEKSGLSPKLAVFDLKSKKFENQVKFDDSFKPSFLMVHNNKIYVYSLDGEAIVINDKYQIESKYSVSGEKIGVSGFISDIVLKDNNIHVLYQNSPDKEFFSVPATIAKFDIVTGKHLGSTPLKVDDSSQWWGEYINYVPLK